MHSHPALELMVGWESGACSTAGLGRGADDQRPDHITCDNSHHAASSWFLEGSHPASDDLCDTVWNEASGQKLSDHTEQMCIPRTVQKRAHVLCGHPRWSPCRSFLGRPQIPCKFVLNEVEGPDWMVSRDLRWDGAARLRWASLVVGNSARVARMPGTKSAPSNACLPTESSPNCTNVSALAALCSTSFRLFLHRLRDITALSSTSGRDLFRSGAHWPRVNASNLAFN